MKVAPGGVSMVIGQNDDIRDNTPQLNNNHCTLDQVFRPCMGLGNSGADAVMRNESRRNDTISPEGKRPEHSIMLNRSCRPAVDQLSIGKERSGVMWLRRGTRYKVRGTKYQTAHCLPRASTRAYSIDVLPNFISSPCTPNSQC